MTLRVKTAKGGFILPDDIYHASKLTQIKARCIVDTNGCWIWQGFSAWNGYGGTNYRGKNWRVHRVAYVCVKGPIPYGHDVCHTCDVRLCCNPDHLWTGPRQLNNRDTTDKCRNKNTQKTHCPSGHPFAEYGRVYHRGYKGWRTCLLCQRERQRVRYQQNREFFNARNRQYRAQRKARLSVHSGLGKGADRG
jgi:hypothetical protein